MAHEMIISLSDEEYERLSAEAVQSGRRVEALVRDVIAAHMRSASERSQAMTSREFTERQYREGKVLNLPTHEPISANAAAQRERLAQRLSGGTPASDMVIEDRGPR